MQTFLKNSQFLLAISIILFSINLFAHGMTENEKQIITEGGNFQYIWIGATHMLSGYDHLAFVFGIVFFLTKFRDIIKYITAFTLGHSITLIFATFNTIQINYFLIDAIIALSVCYIAFHNLNGFKKYLNINAPNMLMVIIVFGLIHGLGLSTRLQELPLSSENLLMNIISFNIGIEIGQVIALVFMLLLINLIRKYSFFTNFSSFVNYSLILMGIVLFIIQINEYKNSFSLTEHNTFNSKNEINITLEANGELEYKLYVLKDDVFTYSWETSKGFLYYDFHGEPAGDTTGYFKTHKKESNSFSKGELIAPFEGTHGWYWKNYNNYPVLINLKISGKYKLIDKK